MAMFGLEQVGLVPIFSTWSVPESKQGETMSREVTTRRLFAASMLLVLAFTSLTQTGCTRPIRRLGILDELAISYRDAVWAKRAYNLRYANCNREYGDHFRNGFCAGYSDMCNGGDGYIPALPPDEYRGFEYQCAEGAKCVESWFKGYPAGVAAAREEKAGKYNELQISRMIDQAVTQTDAPNILPTDVPVTQPSSVLLPPGQEVPAKRLGKMVVAQMPVPKKSAAIQPMPLPSVMRKSEVKTASKTAAMSPATIAPKPLGPPKPAKIAPPIRTASKPTSTVPVNSVPTPSTRTSTAPPIISGSSMKPRVSKPQSKPVKSKVPPIVSGGSKVKVVSKPPIVRGRKIDPVASVTVNETPLPMAMETSSGNMPLPMAMSTSSRTSQTRTASWPINRK